MNTEKKTRRRIVARRLSPSKLATVILVLLLIPGFSQVKAQVMNITGFGGNQVSYELVDIRKLTFSSEQMIIDLSGQEPVSIVLDDIQVIKFNDLSSSINIIRPDEIGKTSLFPNPVVNQLNLRLELDKHSRIMLSIQTIDGRIVREESIEAQSGTNEWQIDLSELNAGMYFCRISTMTQSKTVKFLITQ